MVEQMNDDKLEKTWKEERYYSGIRLEGLRKTTISII
jgi:hypothetical protein